MMQIMEGSHAVAEAVKYCRPQVIAAYPITPQTHIVEALASMVANCETRLPTTSPSRASSRHSLPASGQVPPDRGRTPPPPRRGLP